MERKRLVVGAAALMVVLLMLSPNGEDQGVKVAMARTCESQSHQFSGGCVSDHNCGLVCRNEGFTDGWCRGFRRRCFCTRPC